MPDYYSCISPKYEPYVHQRRIVTEVVDSLTNGMMGSGIPGRAMFCEMATGKTKMLLDSCMVMYGMRAIDGLVVLAPKSVVKEWKVQCKTHVTIPYSFYDWNGKATKKEDYRFSSFLEAPGFKVMAVNIEAFQTVPEAMRLRVRSYMKKFKTIIACDESSFIGNHESNRTINSSLAAKYSLGRVIMTGTETGRNILPLYSQFEWLYPGFWGMSFFQFKLRYCDMMQEINKKTGKRYYNIIGYKNLDELFERIKPYVSRARKSECPDIPEKIFKEIWVDISKEQKSALSSLKNMLTIFTSKGDVSYENKAVIYGKARQILGGAVKVEVQKDDCSQGVLSFGIDDAECEVHDSEAHIEWIDKNPPKLQALIDSIKDHDNQAIIWSVYTHEINMIEDRLKEMGESCIVYDGKHVKTREQGKQDFIDGKVRFFIGNPAAGAYGLNLQNCHIQYFYSAPTSPIVMAQVIDRTNRPGQRHDCVYIKLFSDCSIDRHVKELIDMGIDIQEAVKNMDTEALKRLFYGDSEESI